MQNLEQVWQRLYPRFDAAGNLVSGVPDLKGRALTDFRYLGFPQEFVVAGTPNLAAGMTTVGPTAKNFPGGAIILQITADAFPEGQPDNPFLPGRNRFRIQQSYATNEQLLTQPGLAAAVMGDAEYGGPYPGKELYLPPNQNILTQLWNLTPEQIRVTVTFHALVWRFAQ